MRPSRQSWLHRRTSYYSLQKTPSKFQPFIHASTLRAPLTPRLVPHDLPFHLLLWLLQHSTPSRITCPFLADTHPHLSRSLKDLSKAIVAYLSQPTPSLPDDLVQTIDAYLRRHQKQDDAAADRLQEELFSIFDRHVKDKPTTFAPFLTILRQLLPTLRTPERIFAWWDSCSALLAKSSPEKGVVEESLANIMEIIKIAEEDHDGSEAELASNPLIDRLFTGWMEKLYPSVSEALSNLEPNERITREALVQFGKKHPKYRKAVLRFLGDYLQSQPPHLHQILQTPLFADIMKCLLQDTSTTIVSAALTVLTMLLPQMPSSLVPHLPTLFNIYSRLLFWSRERAGIVEPQAEDADAASWEECGYEAEVDDHPIYHLLSYYTIVYGLYPINFMDYIRKPQRYLRHANVANANDMEVQPTEMRDQSERFRRCHLLHPNFFTLTIDSEKNDFGRWIKSEASEVVAECMALCTLSESDQSVVHALSTSETFTLNEGHAKDAQDPSLHRPIIEASGGYHLPMSASMDSIASSRRPSALVRRGSQSSIPSTRNSIDARIREPSIDSPTLGPHLVQSASHTQLQDMIQSNKVIKSGLHQSLANDSVPSLSLSNQDSVADRPGPSTLGARPTVSTPLSLTETNTQISHLQRQILLLQNDLNFERYLKQQHMAHIGDLRRRHMDEAVTEAETQNLLITNRNLKHRFEEAKKAEMQVRKDSEKSRALAKKWEADLSTKLKKLRDESKKLKSDYETLQKELDNSTAERDKLRVLLCDAEVKEVNWKQNMQSIELHSAEIDRLKSEVARLTRVERDYQAKELEQQRAIAAATGAENKMEALSLQLASREGEIDRTRKLFQGQIAALQTKLSEALEERTRPSRDKKEAIESTLAASREKQAELQRQCDLLMRKYTALQSSLLDMKTETKPGQLRIETSNSSEAEQGSFSVSTSPVMMKTRPPRVLSSPDVAEGTAFNVTPPLDQRLEAAISPKSAGWTHPPGSPDTSSLSMSPDHLRFGRGEAGRLLARSHSDLFATATQNRLRKDSKDKGKDESNGKKDKKPSALRGIRGFMYE
ncbi:Hamartin protein-domain-containing protein [Fusarium venenatum]|uniref:Hamartin protein-domain-containing protein n=1 Tax=Fusarium venenatum TaxID=56646 RepID=UPI001D64CB99|nr:Hamartin protein-domain-containing protein [Fusarium venenatum]